MEPIEIKTDVRSEFLNDIQRKVYEILVGKAIPQSVKNLNPASGRSKPLTNMAKTKKRRQYKGRSKTITIPAGLQHVLFDPKTDKVFMVTPGKEWPKELTGWIEEQAHAYAKQMLSRRDEDQCMRSYSPQESFVEVITAIRRHSVTDQNKIIAMVLNELAASRQNQVAALQKDIETAEQQLVNAVEMQKQLSEIGKGNFISL